MNYRLAIIFACIIVLLGIGLFRLSKLDFETALPEWVPEFRPHPLPDIGERRIALHWSFALALTPTHRLLAWGGSGDEGFPGERARGVEAPVVIDRGLTDWRYVSTDIAASYAVTRDGALLRRAMHVSSAPDTEPPKFSPLFPALRWVKVQQALRSTVALDRDGALWIWHEEPLEQASACLPDVPQCLKLSPDGTIAQPSEALITAEKQARIDLIEKSRGVQMDQTREYWRHQPGGDVSAQALASLEQTNASYDQMLASVDAEMAASRTRYAQWAGKPLAWKVPQRAPWSDLCLNSDGRGQAFEAFGLDAEGKLWRLAFDARNFQGRLEPKAEVTPLATPVPFQRVYCAGGIGGPVMLLDADRRLWGFGDNGNGALSPELKAEENTQKVFPHRIPPEGVRKLSRRRWLSVAPGYGYTLAISSSGALWAWGDDYARRVMRAPAEGAEPVILVDRRKIWVEVSLAGNYIVARDRDGEIYAWGDARNELNPYVRGLLGDGGVAEHREQPRPIVIAPDT